MINCKTFVVGIVASAAILTGKGYSQEGDAYLKKGLANLPKLREESLKLLEASRKNHPEHFKLLMEKTDEATGRLLNGQIRPIDTSGVVGAKYSSYNMDVWRLRAVAGEVFSLAQAYVSPESRYAGKPELVAKATEAFEFILSLMKATDVKPEGTCGCPDRNLDRFTYGPAWEAFVLMAPQMSDDLKARFLRYLWSAAKFQLSTYGNPQWKDYGISGKYPNMDAAYILVIVQAHRLFDDKEFVKDLDKRVALLRECLSGSAWMYILKWNPGTQYTQVTVDWIARAYQLSKHSDMIKQVQAHAEYFKYNVEPSGLMDWGVAPFIKHDWAFRPYSAASSSLEAVHRYEPTPALQTQVDLMYQKVFLSTGWHLYWVAPKFAKAEPLPLNYVRKSPEIAGFQARYTKGDRTITVNATGREIAADSRVSAILSAPAEKDCAVLAGVFLEVLHDGASYYVGDMNPRIKMDVASSKASMAVSQFRHMMGPNSKPMVFGNHMADIKNWKFDCWKGGSPTYPPVETTEKWVWSGDRMTGEITVAATDNVNLDGVRLSLPVAISQMSEQKALPGGEARRYGNLCLSLQSSTQKYAPEKTNNYDFRIDVPTGEYEVTLVSGDPTFELAPFDVVANDVKVISGIIAPKDGFTEKTFSIKTSGSEGIVLSFIPISGDHWKIGALSIVSKDKKSFVKKFDVGAKKVPPMQGYERLSGTDVYTKEKGYGWGRDLASCERTRVEPATNLTSDLITCPPGPSSSWSVLEEKGEWKRGRSVTYKVTIGLSDSLDSWLSKK